MEQKSIVGNLFGIDPALLGQQQEAADETRGLQLAQLDPLQAAAAATFPVGARMGRALGGVLGIEDPQMAENAKILAAKKKAKEMGLDPSSSDGLKGYAKLLSEQGLDDKAMMVSQKALEMAKNEAETSTAQNKLVQEALFRKALSTLDPSDPDYQEKLMQIASKFGSPDKVMDVHMKSLDKQERLQSKKDELEAKLKQQLDIERERGADRLALKQMEIEGRKQIAQMMAALRGERNPPAPTLSTIIDPNDPTQQIVVDARTWNPQTRAGLVGVSGKFSDSVKADKKLEALAPELQGKIASFDQAVESLDRLSKHPGKSIGTGTAAAVTTRIPGTDAYGFKKNLETFKAQTFIPAVSALKGMGALSDAEGKKLTDSVGALDEGMKESEFDAQVELIKKELNKARERAVQRLSARPSTKTATASTPSPSVDALLEKYK